MFATITENQAFQQLVNRLSPSIKTHEDACNILQIEELDKASQQGNWHAKNAIASLLNRIEARDLKDELYQLIDAVGHKGGRLVIKLLEIQILEQANPPQRGRYATKSANSKGNSPRIALSKATMAKIDAIASQQECSRAEVVEIAITTIFSEM